MKECTNDVCGMRRVSRQGRKWSEDVGVEVAENRRAFKEWLQRSDRVTYDKYRAQKADVKQLKLQKEWRNAEGESDWGMISTETKIYFRER